MPKDSQPDNKKARIAKANGQTPITRENQNQNKNAKKNPLSIMTYKNTLCRLFKCLQRVFFMGNRRY